MGLKGWFRKRPSDDEIREEIRQEQEFVLEFRRQHPSALQAKLDSLLGGVAP